jgi:hypothetical protein
MNSYVNAYTGVEMFFPVFGKSSYCSSHTAGYSPTCPPMCLNPLYVLTMFVSAHTAMCCRTVFGSARNFPNH